METSMNDKEKFHDQNLASFNQDCQITSVLPLTEILPKFAQFYKSKKRKKPKKTGCFSFFMSLLMTWRKCGSCKSYLDEQDFRRLNRIAKGVKTSVGEHKLHQTFSIEQILTWKEVFWIQWHSSRRVKNSVKVYRSNNIKSN